MYFRKKLRVKKYIINISNTICFIVEGYLMILFVPVDILYNKVMEKKSI